MPRASNTVYVALFHSHVLSLPRSTLTMTDWLVGLFGPSGSTLGQKSMSSPRVPASAIAARAPGEALANALPPTQVVPVQLGVSFASVPTKITFFGTQTWLLDATPGVAADPQLFEKTWMRLLGRSQT